MRARSHSCDVAAQALDPPAVAAAAQRAPVVERIAPQLSRRHRRCRAGRRRRSRAERARGAPRGRRCGRRRRAGCRRSTARRVRPRTAGARSTRARSAPGPAAAPAPAKRSQSEIQEACAARNDASSPALTAACRVGQEARPARECGARRIGRPRAVGRAERQHLPPGLPCGGEPVDEAVGRRTQPSHPEAT